jgi:DNA-binding NtrC family response regulator
MPATILVVDPDPRTERLCAEVFGGQFSFASVPDVASALGWLAEARPTAVITEVVLPDGDGLSLLVEARRRFSHLPVLVLTAEPTARSASRAVRLHVDDYVMKHSDSLEGLRRAVRGAIRTHARAAEVERMLTEMANLNDQFVDAVERLERTNLKLADRLAPPVLDEEGVWRILVVDDEQATMALLETILRSQAEYEVDGANSATEARQRFNAKRYDVVLTDKNLGDGSGVDLIKEIHDVEPSTRVLLMTGFATIDSAAEAIRHGAVAYLRKPFEDLQEVLDLVAQVVEGIEQERAEQRYLHAFKSRNAAFLARYRLIKNKLATLQDAP